MSEINKFVFDYKVTETEDVLLYCNGLHVRTLTNKRANEFLHKLKQRGTEPQQLVADSIGNFLVGLIEMLFSTHKDWLKYDGHVSDKLRMGLLGSQDADLVREAVQYLHRIDFTYFRFEIMVDFHQHLLNLTNRSNVEDMWRYII
jgi:hypothetical protein